MSRVFQLTREDIDRSSTLEESDIGLWCYVLHGCIEGFHKTKQSALNRLESLDLWDSAS
jgi:hypothetical protein